MKELLLEKWDEIMEFLRLEYSIKTVSYNTWLKNLKFRDIEGNTVIIVNEDDIDANNSFILDKYGKFIRSAIAEVTDYEFNISIISDSSHTPAKAIPSVVNNPNYTSDIKLNPDYTFDNFVVSRNSSIVYAAALKVAEAPGEYYNPLYIYGDPGLGKTHLMHSIAHFIIENSPDLKVMYVTSEKFTNDLVEAIGRGSGHSSIMPAEFREKYRNVDILLIDDIQFIIGKQATQEEFFHTFNYLYDERKQIVISSDKPPRDFDILEERLRSRFECGLIVDITAPDFETKMAILKKKLEIKQKEKGSRIDISDECLSYIANNIHTNIRSLEGALTKVIVLANMTHVPIDLPLVEYALRDMIFPNQKKVITPEFIIQIVAEHFDLNVNDIIQKNRSNRLVIPRHIAIYLSDRYTGKNSTELANIFNRDHTSILHAVSNITKKIDDDPDIAAKVDILVKKLNVEE